MDKGHRGLTVVSTYRAIVEQQGKALTRDEIKLASALGWSLEFLHSAYLITDDMMDQSITRRNKPCWYKVEHVGLRSCNDAKVLEQEVYHIIEIFFHDKPCYGKLNDLLHEAARYIVFGQCMDMTSNPTGKRPKFQLFTDHRYASIAKYKTSLYSFVLPVRIAMYMSSYDSPDAHQMAEEMLIKIGHLYQLQDDYFDCFSDPDITGKIGRDIQEGKSSWPIVTAFKLCDQDQRETLEKHYGIDEGTSVAIVKDIFTKLSIKELYLKEET
ncbi:unnamed protein product, partial [Oppiella nova]